MLIEFLLKSIIFIAACVFCFYIPGKILMSLFVKSLEDREERVLAIPVGIVVFTFLSWLLALLKIRFILPVLIIAGIYIYVKKYGFPKIKPIKINKKLLIIIVLGVIAQNSISFPSGLFFGDKMQFWGVAGRDGMWYLALTESLKNTFPPINPSFSGEILKNYHYFFYLAQAEISNLTQIPVVDLNFRFFPILVSVIFGLSIFSLVKKVTKSDTAGYWALFFSYFSGSFGYIPRLLGFGKGSWETAFWSMQPFSMLQNTQLGFSFVLLVVWLILLIDYLKSKNEAPEERNPSEAKFAKIFAKGDKRILIPLILIAATLPEYKIFGGTLLLGSFFVVSVLEIIIRKKAYLFLAFAATVILFLIIFLPSSAKAPSFFIFEPFWFIRSMIAAEDRLNWVDIELKRQTFAYYHNWPKVIMIETFSLFLFVFGNLGTKFIGLFALPKLISKIKNKEYSLAIIGILAFIFASFIIPLLFLQSGVAWNTIQYFYYFVFVFAVLSGLFVGYIKPPLVISLAIILLSLPTSLQLVYSFYSTPPANYLSLGEFEALNYLKNNTQKNSVILAYYFDFGLRQRIGSPMPISFYDSTSYISAFSGRPVYFADELIEGNAGYNIKERNDNLKTFFTTTNPEFAREFLKKNNISYIYLLRGERFGQKINFPTDNLNFKVAFENDEVKIIKTDVK